MFICQNCLKADEPWSKDAIIECGKKINDVCSNALTELQYVMNTPYLEQCKKTIQHWDDKVEQACCRLAELGYLGRIQWGDRDLVSVRRKSQEVIIQLEDVKWYDFDGIAEDDLETEPIIHFLHHDIIKAMTVLYLFLLHSVSCRQPNCIDISVTHIELFEKLGAFILDGREFEQNCSTAIACFEPLEPLQPL